MRQKITDIEDVTFTAAEIEQALADWYRKTYLADNATANIEIFGIMNRVYITVEHTEELLTDGRNQGGRGKTPANND
jgi:hypothetical protein